MKKCPACGASFASTLIRCPACGKRQEDREGFPAYAPALAQSGDGFKAAYFADIAQIEAEHFWFRARNRLIIWAFGKYCADCRSFLEIGCGTGYVLSGIAKAYPAVKLHGSELFTAGLAYAAAREPAVSFMQMDARHIPFVDEFDAIGAFDVLEHIEEDERVLAQVRDALRERGVIVLTVPQHAWMWSPIDEYACHVRRYSAKGLHAKIERAGFEILCSTSFVSALLPVMWASRFRHRHSAKDADVWAEARPSSWMNALCYQALRAELAMIRRGLRLPLGGSRLIAARKT